MHAGDYGKFYSDCTQTMVGFVQSVPNVTGERHSLKDMKAKCFVGNLDKPIEINNLMEFSQEVSKVTSLTELSSFDKSSNQTLTNNQTLS